jgi:shikimate kinase/3-dehydroquinate synthase
MIAGAGSHHALRSLIFIALHDDAPSRITDIAGWNAGPQPILDAMFQDKKVERGALTFILARGIGQTFIAKGVPAEAVSDFLRDELGQ